MDFSLFMAKIMGRLSAIFSKYQASLLINGGRDHFFVKHIMEPSFNYSAYRNTLNPYFLKYGFKYSMAENEYYGKVTGIKSDYYIPQTFFYYFLHPYLNRAGYIADKNMFRKILVNNSNREINWRMPYQIVYNQGGLFYTKIHEHINKETAVSLILGYDSNFIIKPTLETTWGRGIQKLNPQELDENKINSLFDKYKEDFSVEECIEQHPDMGYFNPTSVNTIRIVTYRKPSGEIKVLYSLLRYGKPGAIVDNASAGGSFLAINDDGTIDFHEKEYKSLIVKEIENKEVAAIPFYDKIVLATKYLHNMLPTLNYVGWDMTITEDGTPVLIEFNSKSAVELGQLAKGPIFTKEDLDEIMPNIAKWRYRINNIPTTVFPDKPGHIGMIKR